MFDVHKELGKAVRHFWETRLIQHRNQGAKTGNKDAGTRGAVTGGKHADGFVNFVAGIIKPTKHVDLSPFRVDEGFQGRSYAKRYELVCERLLRERLYDAACFFTSNSKAGMRGIYNEPNQELSIRHFAISLHTRATAFAKLKGK